MLVPSELANLAWSDETRSIHISLLPLHAQRFTAWAVIIEDALSLYGLPTIHPLMVFASCFLLPARTTLVSSQVPFHVTCFIPFVFIGNKMHIAQLTRTGSRFLMQRIDSKIEVPVIRLNTPNSNTFILLLDYPPTHTHSARLHPPLTMAFSSPSEVASSDLPLARAAEFPSWILLSASCSGFASSNLLRTSCWQARTRDRAALRESNASDQAAWGGRKRDEQIGRQERGGG